MVQSVLAILDGGAGDAIVHETAVTLASHGKAAVSVLGITDPKSMIRREPVPVGAIAMKQQADERRYRSLRTDISESADRLSAVCASLGAATSAEMAEGDPMRSLNERWSDHDLLLLGREQRGEGTKLFPRRSLLRLLRECPKPVMVGCAARSSNPETVAIAYDGSVRARRALDDFVNLGLARGRRLEVVCVATDAARGRNLVDEAAATCANAGTQYQVYLITAEKHGLWALANRLVALKPGAMVLPSAEGVSWREMIFGSLTARLIRASGATLFLHR